MAKSKKVRTRGKIRLSSYFKKFKEKDKVAIVKEQGVRAAFPQRIVGKSGKVAGSRGRFLEVEIVDGKKKKTFIIHPVHLKKLKRNGN